VRPLLAGLGQRDEVIPACAVVVDDPLESCNCCRPVATAVVKQDHRMFLVQAGSDPLPNGEDRFLARGSVDHKISSRPAS
jgi:hypothetical protein